MPKQIRDPRSVPRGLYDYTVSQTGLRLEAHVFPLLVSRVRKHMLANGIEVPNNLSAIIEEDFCTRNMDLCVDTDAPRVDGEDVLTKVAAAIAIPAADALHALGQALGINCEGCNKRHQIIRELRKRGVVETLKLLKGTL